MIHTRKGEKIRDPVALLVATSVAAWLGTTFWRLASGTWKPLSPPSTDGMMMMMVVVTVTATAPWNQQKKVPVRLCARVAPLSSLDMVMVVDVESFALLGPLALHNFLQAVPAYR